MRAPQKSRPLALLALLAAAAPASPAQAQPATPPASAKPSAKPDAPLPPPGKLPMKNKGPAKPPPSADPAAGAPAPAAPPAAPAPAAPAAPAEKPPPDAPAAPPAPGKPTKGAAKGAAKPPAEASSAPADEPPETVDAAAAERARKLMTEGARLHDDGKFSEAYVALVAAWAIWQTPTLAKNLADCEMAIGKHRDAAEHLRYIVKNPAAKPDDQKRAQAQLDEALKKIGTFRISVSIDNAEVLLDGASLGKSPLKDSVYVTAGKHTFEARRDRYEPDQREVEAAPGSAQIVRLQLTAGKGSPDAPATGYDTVRPWIIRGGLGLTVLGVAIGAGMTVLANKQSKDAAAIRSSDLPGMAPCASPAAGSLTASKCADLKSTLSQQSRYANAAVGMFSISGVAALVTAGLWTVTVLTKDQPFYKPLIGQGGGPSRTPGPGLTPSLFAGAHEGGAALSGRW